jgi:ParB family chromosome partitioning protein
MSKREQLREHKEATFKNIMEPASNDGSDFDVVAPAKVHEKRTKILQNAVAIPVDLIVRDETQPREDFDQEFINDLAESIKKHGLKNPISVSNQDENGKYKIIAGENRYRACILAGKTEIECLIRDNLSASQRLAEQLIENNIRRNLNDLETAIGMLRYKSVLDAESGSSVAWHEVETVLDYTKRRRQQIIATTRLPEQIQKEWIQLKVPFTERHSRIFTGILNDHPELQIKLWESYKQKLVSPDDLQLQAERMLSRQGLSKTKPTWVKVKYTRNDNFVADVIKQFREIINNDPDNSLLKDLKKAIRELEKEFETQQTVTKK